MPDDRTTPSFRNSRINWRESALPLLTKLRLTARNNLIKLRTRRSCCGNFGEPGC